MITFIFLNHIFRRRTDEARPTRLPADEQGAIQLWQTDDTPEVHDTSYADALFDTDARSRLRSDFAGIEPPPGVYSHVLAAIRAAEASNAELAAPTPALKPAALSRVFPAFHRAVTGPILPRVIPGGVAVLLALAALAPNAQQALQGDRQLQQPAGISVTAPAPSTGDLLGSRIALNPDHDHPLTVEERAALAAANPSTTALEDESRLAKALPPLKQLWRAQSDEPQYENRPQGF
ncbi:MAG: hypothetical protein ACJ78Q_19210 [Chloroflexia bacterium]